MTGVRFLLLEAQLGAMGAVEDVGLGHFVVPLAHQLLLDPVLEIFDADELLPAPGDAVGQGGGDVLGRGRIHPQREEGTADRDLDLVGVPGDDLAIAADDSAKGFFDALAA